jgi:hypothetical protein
MEDAKKMIGVNAENHGSGQIVQEREDLLFVSIIMLMNQPYAQDTEIVLQTIGVFAMKIQNSEEDLTEDHTDTKEDVGKKKKVVNITRIVIDHAMDMGLVTDLIAIIMLIGWV